MKRLGNIHPKYAPLSSNPPHIAVLVAAYNEAENIESRVRSTFLTDYPLDKLELWIGTDACTDATDQILAQLGKEFPALHHISFNQRTGKPAIINHLVKQTNAEILVLTDADTLFFPDTLTHLIRPFFDPEIGGVQGSVSTVSNTKKEIGHLEVSYNNREQQIKMGESAQGAVIGAYGSGYAIRSSLYIPVPPGFAVDDFFLFMSVLEQNKKTVLAPEAKTLLRVDDSSEVQFRRKVRIGRGNYRNALHFSGLLHPSKGFLAYAFFSHKIIRWLGPFLFLLIFLLSSVAHAVHPILHIFWILQWMVMGIALLDSLLKSRISMFRIFGHFIRMNIALGWGIILAIWGNKSTVWNNRH